MRVLLLLLLAVLLIVVGVASPFTAPVRTMPEPSALPLCLSSSGTLLRGPSVPWMVEPSSPVICLLLLNLCVCGICLSVEEM